MRSNRRVHRALAEQIHAIKLGFIHIDPSRLLGVEPDFGPPLLLADQTGDIALGYSASSNSLYPAIRYTGRAPSDPAGRMETEASLLEGSGSQTGGLSRWGTTRPSAS